VDICQQRAEVGFPDQRAAVRAHRGQLLGGHAEVDRGVLVVAQRELRMLRLNRQPGLLGAQRRRSPRRPR
jgi:hypothetical protein